MDDTVLVEDVLSSSGSSVEMVEDVDEEMTRAGRDDIIYVVRRRDLYVIGMICVVTLMALGWYLYQNVAWVRLVEPDEGQWVKIHSHAQHEGQYLLDYDHRVMYPIQLVAETPPSEDTLISSVNDVFQMLQKRIQPRLRRGVYATRHLAKEYYKRLTTLF